MSEIPEDDNTRSFTPLTKDTMVGHYRTLSIFLLLASMLFVFVRCVKPPQTSYQLTILHTNDIHGQFVPVATVNEKDTIYTGGCEALSHHVREERNKSERVLLLDAGDIMTGNLICDIEYEDALGGGLVAMMNRIGYDALVPGNHMYDHSLSNMQSLAKVANFPFICCNLMKRGEISIEKPYVIVKLNGLRIGIIGVTYHPLVGLVPAPRLEGYESLEPIEIVTDLVREIDPNTDVIILLSHAGIDIDFAVAERVTGIDLIVSGHNHLLFDTLLETNRTIIAQAGSHCQYLGIVNLQISADTVQSYSSRLIRLRSDSIQPDTAVSRMTREFEKEIESNYCQVIGELKCRWQRGAGWESNIGNWLADAIRRRLNADVAFINSGGIRRDINPGPLTKRDIMELLPFDNYLVTFECTGEQLLQIAKHSLITSGRGYSMALQFSGLTYAWRDFEGEPEIIDAMINGELIDNNRNYSVASIDYIVQYNSEKFFGFEVKDFSLQTDKMTPAIIDEIRATRQIISEIEGRVKRIE